MTFRVIQGVGGAIMFPAALAIVVQTFPLRERGKALAIFFGVAGGLTAIGPIVGGYLTEWTWRAIFWINIPVAIIALILIACPSPRREHRPARMDYRGLVLIAAGVAPERVRLPAVGVVGLGRCPRPWLCIVVGAAAPGRLLLRRAAHRGAADARCSIFRIRPFLVREPRARRSRCWCSCRSSSSPASTPRSRSASRPSDAGLFLLYFFLGFVIAAQIGGRMLDRGGAKRPVVIGCIARGGRVLPVGRPGHRRSTSAASSLVHHPRRRRHGA